MESCDLKRLVQDVTEMISGRAIKKKLELRLNGSGEFPQFVRTDANKLRQVLINLLDNAVKFTEKGFVELRLNGRSADDGDCIMLTFEVEDTGTGISPEDQQRIFEPFVQAGNQGNQKGTGLGLAISRQFVELMGGTLEVASELGKGARFRLQLPVETIRESEMMSLETPAERTIGVELDRPDYRILIVEDVEENRLMLKRLMENVGFEVRLANDGEEGVETFQSWHPHFIWMDLKMPVMDGKIAARRIRARNGGREVKIVAVTASAFASDREELLAAGVDDFVRKPYQPSEIFDCVARHLGLRRVFAKSQEEQRTVPLSKEGLEALPQELVGELKSAVVTLNNAQIQGVIAKISQRDAQIGEQLTYLATRFEYSAILKACQLADDKSPG
jgi:CheY-like chemotaxis protein